MIEKEQQICKIKLLTLFEIIPGLTSRKSFAVLKMSRVLSVTSLLTLNAASSSPLLCAPSLKKMQKNESKSDKMQIKAIETTKTLGVS